MHTYFGGFGQTVISSLAKQLLSIVTISLLSVFLYIYKKRLSCVYSGGKKGLQLVIPRQMLLEELNG